MKLFRSRKVPDPKPSAQIFQEWIDDPLEPPVVQETPAQDSTAQSSLGSYEPGTAEKIPGQAPQPPTKESLDSREYLILVACGYGVEPRARVTGSLTEVHSYIEKHQLDRTYMGVAVFEMVESRGTIRWSNIRR